MDIVRSFLKYFRNLDKKKRIYFIAISVIVFIMVWAFISAGIITANFNRAQVKSSANSQKIDAIGLIITETKEGKKYFEIYGESGSYNNDHSIATLNNVVGNFYKDNEVAMSFQSTKGSYDEKTGYITLYENTYIVLKDSTSLQSDRLTWYGSDKDTIAEGNVKIKKGDELNALADQCIISPGYEKFKIVGRTQTRLYGKDK